MGLLKSIGKIAGIAGSFLGAPGVSTALGVGGDLLGGFFSDERAEGAASTAWQRNMDASNTSYQRAVADMRAAGLNPILAYSQGGASTPTAQVAKTTDFSHSGTKAVHNALTTSQVANTQQSTRTAAAQERATLEAAEQTRLNNQGLRALPPEYRALATMGSSTGAGVAAGAHALKTAAPLVRSLPKAVRRVFDALPGRGKGYDVYKGFTSRFKK